MPTLREIKRRIASVRSTQQITRAMKMVAAGRLRRAQQRLFVVRPYAYETAALARRLMRELDHHDLPLLLPPAPDAPVTLVLYTADRGLCGAFNTNLLRAARRSIASLTEAGRQVLLVTVGRKGARFFRALYARQPAAGVRHEDWPGLYETASMNGFVRLSGRIEADVAEGRTSEARVLFSLFHSPLRQTPTERVLVPVKEEGFLAALDGEDKEQAWEPLVEPDAVTATRQALLRFLAIGLYRGLIENWTSEMAARMTAMDAATRNADQFIESLTLEFNKARQAAITREIVDITAGAEALRQQ